VYPRQSARSWSEENLFQVQTKEEIARLKVQVGAGIKTTDSVYVINSVPGRVLPPVQRTGWPHIEA